MDYTVALTILAALSALLTVATSRSTASSTSMKTLADVIAGLRAEVNALHDQRKKDLEEWQAREYQMNAYIEVLVKMLNEKGVEVPSMSVVIRSLNNNIKELRSEDGNNKDYDK